MKEIETTIDTVFRELAELILQRHTLLSSERDDSKIAETEERIDALWPKLDDVQRRSLKGIESDLNWIRRKGEPPPKGRKTVAEVSEQDQRELSAAIRSKNWHRILHYLRLCAPAFEVASLARERSIAYGAIGLPAFSRLFSDSVVEFGPLNTKANGAAILSNSVRAAGAQALGLAPENSVLVWEPNGVKVATTAGEDLPVEAIDYRTCA